MKVLGQPATIDGTGVHLSQPVGETTTTSAPGPLDPLIGPLQARPRSAEPNCWSRRSASAKRRHQPALAQGGITVRLIEPNDVTAGSESSRLARRAYWVTIVYNGSTGRDVRPV